MRNPCMPRSGRAMRTTLRRASVARRATPARSRRCSASRRTPSLVDVGGRVVRVGGGRRDVLVWNEGCRVAFATMERWRMSLGVGRQQQPSAARRTCCHRRHTPWGSVPGIHREPSSCAPVPRTLPGIFYITSILYPRHLNSRPHMSPSLHYRLFHVGTTTSPPLHHHRLASHISHFTFHLLSALHPFLPHPASVDCICIHSHELIVSRRDLDTIDIDFQVGAHFLL